MSLTFWSNTQMFHDTQNLSPEDQYFDDLLHSLQFNAILNSGTSNYDLCGGGDIFKVPEPIIEQPVGTLNDVTFAMPMSLCEEEVISQAMKHTDIEMLQNDDCMSNAFYEYKDFMVKETLSPFEVMNFELPAIEDDSVLVNDYVHVTGKIIKSMSSDSLTYVDVAQTRLGYLDLNEMELNKVHGMRRAFSEGYIKPQLISDHNTETRLQKLSRYRDKKTKRKFGRKIKYACRKALADGQPRIKGRFAKT